MTNRLFQSLFMFAVLAISTSAMAATTTIRSVRDTSGINLPDLEDYDSDTRDAIRDSESDAQRAIQDNLKNTTYTMDQNGFLVPTDGNGQALLPGGQAAPQTEEEKKGFNQRANDPAKQIYKGADAHKKPLIAPRTHRMYEDTRY